MGVGDGGAAAQCGVLVGEPCVNFAVHAADEVAGDGTQQVDGLSGGNARFQAVDVGFQGLSVAFGREDEGRVDVDAFGGEFADGLDTR